MAPLVTAVRPLPFVWGTADPFLFCVHHDDHYPAGDARLGPVTSLAGRSIGADFSGQDGWSMYHGDHVPGFPSHPHRGFETVTFVRRGLIDHSDSLGASGRFGGGDVQWMTAGKGVVHSEMFPLLDRQGDNPVELFQIWLNLPRADKMVDPHYAMLWREEIPVLLRRDEAGREAQIQVVAGPLFGVTPPPPPPSSWAAQPEHEVAIWSIRLAPGARLTLPPASARANRTLYLFAGGPVDVGEHRAEGRIGMTLRADLPVPLINHAVESELLLLQGRPIDEPVVQHGPFVMNTQNEIRQAFMDYQRTGFGGWPWPAQGPTHGHAPRRFAKHADGRNEERS